MASLSPERTHHRARLASATSRARRRPNDPAVMAERDNAARDYWTAAIAEYIEDVVSKAPPLTEEQRRRIRAIVDAAGGDNASRGKH